MHNRKHIAMSTGGAAASARGPVSRSQEVIYTFDPQRRTGRLTGGGMTEGSGSVRVVMSTD